MRPSTPPQLQLNLEFGTAKQREEYARDVLQQVFTIEAARSQQGFGSSFISEDDKQGAINDEFAGERAQARWQQAQDVRRASLQMESARSNPERQRPEQHPITFHPQPRQRPPQSARPAAASSGSWNEDLHTPPRPRTSLGTSGGTCTFLTGTNFEEAHPQSPSLHSASATGLEMPRPRREASMHVTRTEHSAEAGIGAAQSIMEKRMECWEQSERAQMLNTRDAADVNAELAQSRERWAAACADTMHPSLDYLEDYVGLDPENRQRIELELKEVELQRLTIAHYSQQGLPYVIRASADMTHDRLDKLRESTDGKKSRVENLIDKSQSSRIPGEDTMRQTITEAIREENKVIQRMTDDGRLTIAPAAAAAPKVSEPGPISWPEPAITWQRDPFTGDWYRPDKVGLASHCACVPFSGFMVWEPLAPTISGMSLLVM